MNYLLIALIGLFGGLSSGLFGIGGGTIFVPLLIMWAGLNAHSAIGTSIAVIVPTALIAAIRHGQANMIEWKIVFLLLGFALLGAWIGASFSIASNVQLLRRGFAVFLFFVSLKLFFQNA